MKPMPSAARVVTLPSPYIPPFENGEQMDQETFHALYEQTPKGFRAELIEGVVHLPSPVTLRHGRPHRLLCQWLGEYADDTLGTDAFLEVTAILSRRSEPQPDLSLIVVPEAGGRRPSTRPTT